MLSFLAQSTTFNDRRAQEHWTGRQSHSSCGRVKWAVLCRGWLRRGVSWRCGSRACFWTSLRKHAGGTHPTLHACLFDADGNLISEKWQERVAISSIAWSPLPRS